MVDLQADRGGIVFLKLPYRIGVVGSGEASFINGLQRGWNASELNLAVIAAGLLGEPLRFGLPELLISDLGWTSRFGGASPSVSRLVTVELAASLLLVCTLCDSSVSVAPRELLGLLQLVAAMLRLRPRSP